MISLRSRQSVCFITAAGAAVLLAATAAAQSTINAQVTGGGGTSKCTFEVRVDRFADVQIRGNQGYLQTKAGMPAQWVRLRCNQPLPRNTYGFRFAGVDGRGKQYLLRDPNRNNGVAVIRIEDSRNSYEGYTGDIMWNGGNNNGGNWNQWWNDNWNGGGGWNPPPSGGQWNSKIVPNCQNSIRSKVNSQIRGASVNFIGSPSVNQAASFIAVNGSANVRDNQGRMGQIAYRCTMHPNGNVAESSFNVTQAPVAPQPR